MSIVIAKYIKTLEFGDFKLILRLFLKKKLIYAIRGRLSFSFNLQSINAI